MFEMPFPKNEMHQSCIAADKECRYPVRERKLVFLDSQFQKIISRVKYLENELRVAKSLSGKGLKTPSDDEISGEVEEYIEPFETDTPDVEYFGTATCQVFDSSLNSFLFKFTQQTPDEPLAQPSSRFYLEDPSFSKPFSGLMMLPDKEYAVFLVQKVLDFLGHEYFLIDADEFFAKLNDAYESLSNPSSGWLCYLLATLAVGEQYLNESSDEKPPGMRFFAPAMDLFKNFYENPSLELVQTLLLLAFYQQGLNRSYGAFTFYGMATRTSLMMGLHKARVHPNKSPVIEEKRKRVWWTCIIMDSIWSAKLGQPIHIMPKDIDVDLPDVGAVDLHDGFDNELLACNTKLVFILGKIMRGVYRNTPNRRINLKSIIECLEELDALQRTLPSRIRETLFKGKSRSVANLYLRLNQAVIITTRPLVLSIFKGIYEDNAITRRVVQKCTVAAKTSIDILSNLKNIGWVSTFGFWDAQYLFSSLLILIMSSLSGHQFSQIETGRRINDYMKDAGNFTAIENDYRLKELDQLLDKIDQKRSVKSTLSEDFEADKTPIGALISEISENFKDNTGITKDQPHSAKDSYDHLSSSALETISLTEDGPGPQTNLFKEELSPKAWNSLVSNLQFWDSSAFGDYP
ncbi:hypothetical protein PSN45_004466 [Yamadazyma tenuis]|uniref:Xylanolytic transcriptional activator regulatory domain-containing protein n=1 Tax=Candida tenuis (strain ATCC 10573 / BCRC 21748 / CBS 615 / JCM 9827 / NBRC 10315 / NRRL Y-1498 / VKM Y-70) TaxID=590646 RepID=G3B5M4_CANTC|nr:uncharacterized protein CANTEDRAFT_135090 [Yamadazyma tenuis ATCC 10573]EGV63263.1 hypothetical protein CANTEDRAFT_135090 [Yamadazyma tenuis ATCC 10573]WEJ96921.1 hypothetical protein PSN45_004466 [Yamadazyma tenuis]